MAQIGGIDKIKSTYFCSNCGNLYDITNEPPETSEASENPTRNISTEVNKKIYFVCTTCGNHTQIKPRTLIFSKKSKEMTKDYFGSINIDNVIHIPTLPHTRDYTCPNKSCKTHSDPDLNDAVMYRIGNSYKMMYICTVCKTMWK